MLILIDQSGDAVTQVETPPAQFQLFYADVSDVTWLVLKGFIMLLTFAGTGPLAHLLGFHVFLCEYRNICVIFIFQTLEFVWFRAQEPEHVRLHCAGKRRG